MKKETYDIYCSAHTLDIEGKIFDASEKNWCDKSTGTPTTLCYYCGVDSVICNNDGDMVSYTVLRAMNIVFFGCGIENATNEMLIYTNPHTGQDIHII